MGIDTLVRFAKYFGLGSKTGIELRGETAGVVSGKESKQNYIIMNHGAQVILFNLQ